MISVALNVALCVLLVLIRSQRLPGTLGPTDISSER